MAAESTSTESTQTPGGLQNRRAFIYTAVEYAPAFLLLPFILLFLFVAFSRLTTPFELEWNEGQTAVQAWRFSQGLSLYPEPESGWVPYMYAPFYHQLMGSLFWITGFEHLAWGRLISLMGTIGTLLFLIEFVFHRTNKLSLGLVSAGLYASFYAASGFWYDLARNDSATWFFALLGVSLCCRKSSKPRHCLVGLFFLCLGTWTKQPVFPLLLLMAVYAIMRGAPLAKAAAFVIGLGFINLLAFYPAFNNPKFWHYVVNNALEHANDYRSLLPSSGNYGFSENPLQNGFILQPDYWEAAAKTPPRIWGEILFPCTALLLALAAIVPLSALHSLRKYKSSRDFRSSIIPGVVAIFVLLWSLWASVGAYTKFGGYNNNWMPFFLTLSAIVPLGCGKLYQHSQKASALAACALGCSSVFHLGTQFYNPYEQIPTEEDYISYERLIDELTAKYTEGETVWVPHHQWYARQTGHPVLYNFDMVRCATYAGDPVPQALLAVIAAQSVDWILLNAERPQDEWLPPGTFTPLLEAYAPAHRVEGHQRMIPVAGAPQRPVLWYKQKVDESF